MTRDFTGSTTADLGWFVIDFCSPFVWDGGGTTNNWSEAANWCNDVVPGSADVAIFNATSVKDATIDVAINVAGIDIQAGYTGTITQPAGITVTVGASGYVQAAGTFSGGDSTIDINGPFTLSGGSFTATSGTIIAKGDWTYVAGTLTAGSGTVNFGGNGGTISGSHTLNNVTFDTGSGANRTWTIAAGTTLTVDGTLTLDNSTSNSIFLDTGTIAAQGDIAVDSENYAGTATILINGSGDQTFTGSSTFAPNGLPNVEINKPSGTLTLVGTIPVAKNWTYTAGTIAPGTSTKAQEGSNAGGGRTRRCECPVQARPFV